MNFSKLKSINLIILMLIGLIIFFYIYREYNIFKVNKAPIPKEDKIVIANVAGTNGNYGSGLGNQLFTFSYAYSFAKKIGATKILIKNNSSCEGTREDFQDLSKRCYALHKFGVKYPTMEDLTSFTKEYNEIPYIIDSFGVLKKDKHFFSGSNVFFIQPMFDSKRMFKAFKSYKNEIKDLLKYQDPLSTTAKQFLNKIESSKSVSVHIRRGDFKPLNRDVPLSYQIKAMYFIYNKISNPTFFVFSDDQKYVMEHLKDIENIKKDLKFVKIKHKNIENFYNVINNSIFVSQEVEHSLEEFYLMSQCKHNIIANSTFSWWAAFLNKNPNKIVIAPKNPPKEQAHPYPPAGEWWIEQSIN